ncbi:peroxiredoxin-like family protein [Galbibacter mesophilus]|uniref:peroxiredoxin-like family protein n=1 Tax=Galbibacter mesophilus TaxID=379069 RepID=UPI00191DA61E|nr:peroxiredoxin-like family protein [Galbibacter mesophilus]MCM5663316.1 AhpC/TSA family protein [Galbibacter mesophilus]
MKPLDKVPNLSVDLINDTKWELSSQKPESFTMLVFYRGLHCPVCKIYLEELTSKLDDFEERGVNVIAISANTKELAQKTADEWDISTLPLGYGLSKEEARKWGLYISSAIADKEPETFFEPGLFLVKPDQTLYACSVQSMPFARPDFDDILDAIDFVKKKDYPPRGVE